MGRKSRSKFNRMLRAKPATSAPEGRLSDRERMRRVLWKMVERYEQDLTAGEAKPAVTGSQAIAAMRMLRDIDKEEAATEAAEQEQADAEVEQMLAESERKRFDYIERMARGRETADAASRAGFQPAA